jgi:hypothetical protein
VDSVSLQPEKMRGHSREREKKRSTAFMSSSCGNDAEAG